MNEIELKVLEILSEVCKIPRSELDGNTSIESLGLDSLDNLDTMMKLEDAFSVELDAARFSLCMHVSDLISEIENFVGHKS